MRFILILLITSSVSANCLEKYQESYEKKMEKYSKAMKRYQSNKSNAMFSRNIIVSSIGQKLEPPTKDNMFEEEILRSAGLGYEYLTETVMDIHKELKPKHPFIEVDMIKNEFKKGIASGDFCRGIFGKYRVAKAKKYVLKKLKAKRDIAQSDDESIVDSDLREEPVKTQDTKVRVAPNFIIQKR